jgi:hypothetical protein
MNQTIIESEKCRTLTSTQRERFCLKQCKQFSRQKYQKTVISKKPGASAHDSNRPRSLFADAVPAINWDVCPDPVKTLQSCTVTQGVGIGGTCMSSATTPRSAKCKRWSQVTLVAMEYGQHCRSVYQYKGFLTACRQATNIEAYGV